jgi:hypothetical protein
MKCRENGGFYISQTVPKKCNSGAVQLPVGVCNQLGFLISLWLVVHLSRVKVKECCIFICFCCNCEGLNLELSYGQIDDKEPPKVVKKGKSSLESLHARPI